MPHLPQKPPKVNWSPDTQALQLALPQEFSFAQNLAYLTRSPDEPLHRVHAGYLYKLLNLDNQPHLLAITEKEAALHVTFLTAPPSETARQIAIDYIWQWFDLDTDFGLFYRLAGQDTVLGRLVKQYYGLRLIGIPDLFEALCWAIIGQQINLTFAYRVKRKFVETFGQKLIYQDQAYWVFPTPERVAGLTPAGLRPLQFSSRKAEYIIDLAGLIQRGELAKTQLLALEDFHQQQKALEQIRGVGRWTANYVLMKSFRQARAFPIDDVGLHNAIKQEYRLAQKPTLAEIRALFAPWQGWEAYATFYLWRALIN